MRRIAIAFFACSVTVVGFASAQTPFYHQGYDRLHPPDSALPNEQVDPASGTLTVMATDLVLPGNAGFNLAIQRVYNSAIFPDYATGSTHLEERSWAGVGWKLHFGRILHADSQTAGEMEVEMGDGSRHPLYHSVTNPNIWTTSDFWLYNPATNVLQLPNGQVYTFGRVVYPENIAGDNPLGEVLYVTELDDPFGNAITFSYFTDPDAPPDGIASIHQVLSATESRDVTFTYDSTLHALASMTYLSHTWTYSQSGSGPDGDPLLVSVTPPQGPATTYEYGTSGLNGELTAIQAPFGGTIAYAYQDATRTAGSFTTTTRVVASRTMSGHDVATGTWTFAYSTGSNQDTSVITCPCGGTTSYRFNGTGLSGDFSGWSAGTLAEVTVVDGSTTLDDRHLTWTRSDAISNDPVTGPNGVWSDPAVYRPLLATQTITRDGSHTWTTTNTYHSGDGSLNDFGQPYDISEQGETVYQTRDTTRTFQTGFTPYIVGRVASQTTTETSVYGATDGTTTSSWTYDLATGFLTAQTLRGITTSFEERADGNVNASLDAWGNRTAYSYDWGQVSVVQTPNTTTTATIAPEGLVTASVLGDLNTTYSYDAALRLTTVQPPGTNAITYAPDDLHGTYVRVLRGGSTVEHDVDAFGRAIRTSNSQGLTVALTRDSCGRVTNASDPYTTTPQTLGTSTVYDALGRITQVTDPAGQVTTYGWSGINLTRTDANAHATAFGSIAFGDPSEARLASVFDAASGYTQYGYDVTGALTTVVGPASGLARHWTVDSRGLVTSETQPESGTTTYTYDRTGALASTTDANNQTTTFSYDGDGRLISRDAPGSDDDLTITYDSSGRVHTLAGGGSTTTYTYDVANRTVTRSDVTAAGTFTSTSQDDANDNLAQITYPTGRLVDYSYDAENDLLAVTYTPPGSQTSAPFATNFTYGADGRLASYVTGAVTHQFTYDANRPKHLFTTGGTDTLDLYYTYDHVGNVLSIADPRSNANQTFTTDALDRLLTANGPWGAQQWTYDASGNRVTQAAAGGTTTYTYDAPTQRLTSTSGAEPETFTYDSVGQLTSDGLISQYTYTPTGHLKTATGAGVSATYSYDAAGERLSSSLGSQTTYTIRGMAGETLTEYLDSCGAVVWTRDLIYAGGQLLGAAKATTTIPTLAMASTTATVSRQTGTASVNVRLTTPNGAALGCAVSAHYQTADGTALAGTDYTATSGTVTFATGAASGSTQTIAVQILPDSSHQSTKTFTLTLSSPTGAVVGTPSTTTVTILDVTTRGDFDGDGKSDLSVWRSTNGTWYWLTSSSNDTDGSSHQFGNQSLGDVPLVADVDGDRKTDLVVWRASTGTWYWATSSSGYTDGGSVQFGNQSLGDQPFIGDVDGDGKSDFVVWRASTGTWYWLLSSTGYTDGGSLQFGDQSLGDVPHVADIDGDGKADLVVWRASTGTWYWRLSSLNYTDGGSQAWGDQTQGDVSLLMDIDGDGRADLVVWRASTGTWKWLLSSTGYDVNQAGAQQFGNQSLGDRPIVADVDGDGKADLVVWRASTGTFYWLSSSLGYGDGSSKQWGNASLGDVPMPGGGQ